jgi:transposase-like protein
MDLSGPKIKEKAKEFAQQFGLLNFKGSDGWLEGFKKRNSSILRSVKNQTESESNVNFMEIVFLPLLKRFQPRDIFTLGELAFFFRATPLKTFGMRNNCVDGKFSRERFTIGLGANKSGTEKLPLMVIGKHSSAHIFRKAKSLPVKYESQHNAWMTEEFFEMYMMAMDKKFAKENRYVLVVVETTSAHSSTLIAKLGNIQLVFQQPNTSSPLRLGIVKNLKNFYRKEIVIKEVNALVEPGSSAEPIDELEAMTLLAESWEKVTGNTIKKSFAKVGWVQESEEIIDEDDDDLLQMEGPVFKNALRILKLDINSYMDFVCIDDHVATSRTLTDEDICRIVSQDADQGPNFKYISSQIQNVVSVKETTLPKEVQEPSGKLTRRTLSASEKLEIIERKQSGNETNAELCEAYGVSKSTMQTIIQSAEKLKSYIEKNPHMIDCKKFRRTKEPRLDKALCDYVKETKDSSELTKTKIKEKALELAMQLDIHDFRASDGWWTRFKARSGIGLERKTAEVNSCQVKIEDPLGM